MIDTQSVDLLAWIERDSVLKRVSGTRGGEWHGPCPFCRGKDRFIVQPYRTGGGRWFCRQCSEHWQDVIAYVQKVEKLDFAGAMRRLDLPPAAGQMPRRAAAPSSTMRLDQIALNDPAWQAGARALVEEAIDWLWSADSTGRNYWRERGISEAVMRERQLGYLPSLRRLRWGTTADVLPRGVVIPHEFAGQYWNVRVRRFPSDCSDQNSKYRGPKGGASALYGVGRLVTGCIAVVVEGEIDALSIDVGVTLPNVVAVATGSAYGARNGIAIARLALAEKILLAFDTDQAGEQAASHWQSKFPDRAVRLKPTQHDVNNMLLAGEDLNAWIAQGLAEGQA